MLFSKKLHLTQPNDDKIAFKWDSAKIVQQLRACGVLETVRISAAGFPSRWAYSSFLARYFLLGKLTHMDDDEKAACMYIVKSHLVDDDKYRFGNTQIFFRAGQVAYMEQIRTEIRRKYIVIVQSMVRRFICRHKFLRLKRTALSVQRYGRGYLARKKAEAIRQNRASKIIQSYVRRWLCRQRYQRIYRSITAIQTHGRGIIARQKFTTLLNNFKATEIQRYSRGYLSRKAFQEKRQHIVKCQAAVRRFLARRLYKKMKTEAKTISHIQKMYKGLENKIISLQQRIDELNKTNSFLKQKTDDIPELKEQALKAKSFANDIKALQKLLEEKDQRIVELSKLFEAERDEKLLILDEKSSDEHTWREEKQQLITENGTLQTKVEELHKKNISENHSNYRNLKIFQYIVVKD